MARRPSVVKRKPKKIKMGRIAAKLTEQKGYGPEPDMKVDYTQLPEFAYSQALNWYSRFIDAKEIDDLVSATMKELKYTPKQISAAKRSKIMTPTLASISRMLQRECILSKSSMNWFREKVAIAIERGMTIREAEEASGVVINIQERTEAKALTFIGDIDEFVDQIWTGETPLVDVKWFEIFTDLGIKPAHAKVLNEHYTNHLAAMEANLGDYAKADLKILLPIYKKIIEVTGSWGVAKAPNQPKKERKPRTPSAAMVAKKEAKAISGIKHKANDEATGLVSVKPSQILGAEALVVYNAKYKVATLYLANNSSGLSVKGTTIINFDPEKSVTKRVAKSMEVVKKMTSATKTSAIKSFTSIKGTALATKGRTSDDTVLVKAFK